MEPTSQKGENLVVECPHCHTRVLPKADNICPACRRNILDMQDVDPNMVSLTVRESQEFPPYCYLCNSYTKRYVRIEGDKESFLAKNIRILGSILIPPWEWIKQTEEGTTNVYVNLPQCEACAERQEPIPLYVDYDQQSMTFVVHKGFRERVQPTPLDGKLPEPNEVDESEKTDGL